MASWSRSWKIILFAALVLVSTAVLLAACGGDDDEEAAPAAAATSEPAAAPAETQPVGLRDCGEGDGNPPAPSAADSVGDPIDRPVADCKYLIGWAFPDQSIPFFISQHYGATTECAAIGVECIILNAGGYDKPQEQVSDVEDLVQLGADAILIDAIDDEALKGAMDDAVRAGTMVISWTVPTGAELVQAYNGTDHYFVGLEMGKAMIETLPNGGDIIVVNGVQGATWATGRWDGFQDALEDAGYTDRINILALQWTDSSRAGAQAVFEDMFLANPDIDAVLVCCDQPALGVADVLEEAAQAQGGIPIITGGGWDEEEKNRIRDGTIRISIVQQPLMDAIQATRMAVAALNGDKIPFFIASPVVRVDQSNVDSVDETFFTHPAGYNP